MQVALSRDIDVESVGKDPHDVESVGRDPHDCKSLGVNSCLPQCRKKIYKNTCKFSDNQCLEWHFILIHLVKYQIWTREASNIIPTLRIVNKE